MSGVQPYDSSDDEYNDAAQTNVGEHLDTELGSIIDSISEIDSKVEQRIIPQIRNLQSAQLKFFDQLDALTEVVDNDVLPKMGGGDGEGRVHEELRDELGQLREQQAELEGKLNMLIDIFSSIGPRMQERGGWQAAV